MVTTVDFDGTLTGKEFFKPIEQLPANEELIKVINSLYMSGNFVRILTARGSLSHENIADREAKYKQRIQAWLNMNGVLYSELSFHKEYSDIYIDDMSAKEVTDPSQPYQRIDSKFTGNVIHLIDNRAIKYCNTSENEYTWYQYAKQNGFCVPDVLFANKFCIHTERILYSKFTSFNTDWILSVLDKFKGTRPNNEATFPMYIQRIQNHLHKNNLITQGEELIESLKTLEPDNTFCHGDFSTTNVLGPILIDPIFGPDVFQSYQLDAAKMIFSLMFYEFDHVTGRYLISRLSDEIPGLMVLVAAEAVRVSTYRNEYSQIANTLISIC